MENRILDSGQQDIMKSPARKILGDIKNVNEDPPSPVSPTANLKLLTRVASHFRKRDFGEDSSGLCEEKVHLNNYDENVDSLSELRKKVSAAIKPRKEKSLSLLCDKFLELFPLEVPSDSNLFISLDQAATQLHTERRRLYDIINVLESLQMASKVGKNSYQWYGNRQLLTTLSELKGMAEEMGYQKKVKAMQKLCYCSPRYQEKELPLTPNSLQADSSRDERSLGVLCQKFLMLFLVSDEGDLVNLEVAARVVLAGSESESASDVEDVIPLHVGVGMGNSQLKAKARRLYDIANVLSSLKLIQKVHCSDSVRKPAFTYCGPKVEPMKQLTPLDRSPLYPTRHSLLRSQRLTPTIEEKAKILIDGGKRKLKRTYSDSVLHPFSECQEFGESGVDNSKDGKCFGEAVLTLHLVDNTATHFSSADAVHGENETNTSRVINSYLTAGTGDMSKTVVGTTHVGVLASEKEAAVQCRGPISQVTNHCQVVSEPHGSKLIRHHSESCVGKTSICVKRRLVKVAPLSIQRSNNMEHSSHEQGANIHKTFVTAPQKSEPLVQQVSCVKPVTNFNNSVFVPYAAPASGCSSSFYIVDNPCIKTSDVCRPGDSCVTSNQNKITSSPVMSTIVMPTVNQTRIVLTEEMLRNGRRLISIPGKSESFSSKRQLLPKVVNNEQRVFLQSSPVAAKNTDKIHTPYQPKWKYPTVKNDSHIVAKDFISEVNKHGSFVAQDKCSYSVITGNDTNGHSRLHLSPNLELKQDFVRKETGTVIGQSSVDNKHYTILAYSEKQGNCNANQKQFSPYVSDDHCYNRQGDNSSLQTADCTSGLVGEEKILLPHVVPGELYTAVKVGSVLQLVPVSSNSLITKI